jgi:hypothetical protein
MDRNKARKQNPPDSAERRSPTPCRLSLFEAKRQLYLARNRFDHCGSQPVPSGCEEQDGRSFFLARVVNCFYVQERNSIWPTREETP